MSVHPKITEPCGACNGRGVVPRQTDVHLASHSPEETCNRCAGSGKVPLHPEHVHEKSTIDSGDTSGFKVSKETIDWACSVAGEIEAGITQWITAWEQWMQVRGLVFYDATFQTEIGGYPDNAIVQSPVMPGLLWRSVVDDNMTNPDTGRGWMGETVNF